jgi:hypothetical protein
VPRFSAPTGSHGPAGAEDAEVDRDAVKQRLADAETRLSRLRTAIEAGADPAALVEPLNAAQEQRAAAQVELRVTKPDPARLTDAEIYAMVDSLGDVGAALNRANPDRMCKIYDSLRLEMVYDHDERAVDVVVKPLGGLVSVSEGDLRTDHTVERQVKLQSLRPATCPLWSCWPCAWAGLRQRCRRRPCAAPNSRFEVVAASG